MRSPGNDDVGAASKREATTECKPLLGIATENIFRNNAFRITGLPIDATAREIAKHADKLKQMTELGIAPGTQRGRLELSPPPTADDIREAQQNLKDPERRILDEFFWFWPESLDCSQTDPAIQAIAAGDFETARIIWTARETNPTDGVVAMHNMAVYWHLRALDLETNPGFDSFAAKTRDQLGKFWRDAVRRWDYLSADDLLWEKVTERVRQLAEARLTTGFVRRMRGTLPVALRKVHAELALRYLRSNAIDLAKMHIGFVRTDDKHVAATDRTIELVLAPTTTQVREQIRNAKQAADASPKTADRTALDLIDQGFSFRRILVHFYGAAPHHAKDLLDEVANTSIGCIVAFQRSTADNRTFIELLERVFPLAETNEVRKRLQDNIKIGRDNWAFAVLKTVEESKEVPRQRLLRFRSEAAPAIGAATHLSGVSSSFGPLGADADASLELLHAAAMVLRNISLDAWNNHHDQTTAIEANELAFNYAIKPEIRERLRNDRLALGQSAPSKDPSFHDSNLQILKKNKRYVIAAAVVLVIGLANLKSCDSPSSSITTTEQPSVANPSYVPVTITNQFALGDQKPVDRSGRAQPQFTPRLQIPVAQPTLRVSSIASAELDRDGAAIDAEKAKAARMEAVVETSSGTVDAKKTELEELDSNLETLSRQIERERIYLDSTSQSDVDDFNLKVNRYNAALRTRKAEAEDFNQMVDTHNTLVQQLKTQNRLVNQMVDNYNAKLQQYSRQR